MLNIIEGGKWSLAPPLHWPSCMHFNSSRKPYVAPLCHARLHVITWHSSSSCLYLSRYCPGKTWPVQLATILIWIRDLQYYYYYRSTRFFFSYRSSPPPVQKDSQSQLAPRPRAPAAAATALDMATLLTYVGRHGKYEAVNHVQIRDTISVQCRQLPPERCAICYYFYVAAPPQSSIRLWIKRQNNCISASVSPAYYNVPPSRSLCHYTPTKHLLLHVAQRSPSFYIDRSAQPVCRWPAVVAVSL